MEATTRPARPMVYTVDLPDDYRTCETCDRSFPEEEMMHYDEAGISVCEDCEAEEMAYWSRQCRGISPVTRESLRADLDWFQPGDKEYRETMAMLATI